MENKQVIEITHDTKVIEVLKPVFTRFLDINQLIASVSLSGGALGYGLYELSKAASNKEHVMASIIAVFALPLIVHVGRLILNYVFNLSK